MLNYTNTSHSALLFPGQGGHDLTMLEGVKDTAEFALYYPTIVRELGESPLEKLSEGGKGYLNRNLISSMLTILTSAVSLQLYIKKYGNSVRALSGYSVGQWTALFASGAINFEELVRIVKKRAELMDACLNKSGGAMLGIIGVKEQDLVAFCRDIEQESGFIAISNYNSMGQYSVAGTAEAIQSAYEKSAALRPKKVVLLPVSGAWHCALLEQASAAFLQYLSDVTISRSLLPVMDNVTGVLLPSEPDLLKRQLAAHLSSPVKWSDSMRFLAQQGCKKMIEIGYGKVLTGFGFFIDFNLSHESFYSR